MKILLLQDHLRGGGTERQSVLLANAFAAIGHDTTLLTFRPGGPLAATVAPGVRHLSLQPFDTRLDWFAPGLGRVAARLAPDVVLCMGRMANCRALTLQRRLPAAVVVATLRTGKPLPWLYRRAVAAVPCVVANSHDARQNLLRSIPLDPARVDVIHNALVFPSGAAPTRDDALRARHGASPSSVVLLDVAMFRPGKNQRALLEMAAGLPASLDWRLWLAGDGPTLPACRSLAASLGIADRVAFLGFQLDPAPLYRAADIAVHASHSEALSNFLIEAQAHGLPVVACHAQGVTECFLPDRTGWAVPHDDPDAFRAALLRLLALPPEARGALAAKAAAHARAAFDPARQARTYLDLFQRLLAARASAL